MTNNTAEVNKLINKMRSARKLQVIVRTQVNYTGMEKNEPVFYEEIHRGITLWEAKG